MQGETADGRSRGTHVLGDGGGTVETQQQTSLQLRLGTLDLDRGRSERHAGPFSEGKVGQVVDDGEAARSHAKTGGQFRIRAWTSTRSSHDLLFGSHVDSPKTSVRVRRRKAHKAVGEVVARDDVRQLGAQQRAGTQASIPVAHDTAHDHHGEVVGRLPTDTLDGDGKVQGRAGVVPDPDLGSGKDGLGLTGLSERDRVRGLGQGGKVLGGELAQLLVVDGTGTNEDHSVGGVVGVDVRLQVTLRDRVDVVLGSEDGLTQGLAGESDGVQVVKDDLFQLLVDLFLLSENDIPLPLDRVLFQLRVLQNVRDDADGAGNVLLERLGVVDGLFTRSVGVQVGTNVLDLELESSLGSVLGSLEGHVLRGSFGKNVSEGLAIETRGGPQGKQNGGAGVMIIVLVVVMDSGSETFFRCHLGIRRRSLRRRRRPRRPLACPP